MTPRWHAKGRRGRRRHVGPIIVHQLPWRPCTNSTRSWQVCVFLHFSCHDTGRDAGEPLSSGLLAAAQTGGDPPAGGCPVGPDSAGAYCRRAAPAESTVPFSVALKGGSKPLKWRIPAILARRVQGWRPTPRLAEDVECCHSPAASPCSQRVGLPLQRIQAGHAGECATGIFAAWLCHTRGSTGEPTSITSIP